MLQIIVYGIPEGMDVDVLENCWGIIKSNVASLSSLGIAKEEVKVWFPKDHLSTGLGEELFVVVEGVSIKHPKGDKPDRDPSIRYDVGEAVLVAIQTGFFLKDYLPGCKEVKIYVKKFDVNTDALVSWMP